MPRGADEKIGGLQKAAILLIALGPEKSASIFKHLKEEEIEELTLEIANTRSVTPQVKEEVIDEFYQVCLAQQYIAEGGISYAKELLEKALGSEKAMDVIGKLTASLQVKPFEFVRKTDAAQLLNFIQDEHPQTMMKLARAFQKQTRFRLEGGGDKRDRQHRSFLHCHRTDRQMWRDVLRLWTEPVRMLSRKWRKYWNQSCPPWSTRITPLSAA